MDEQTTWKGHTFTLLVFTGIVVLCSIFFILGTLVGRAQGLKIAANPALAAAAKTDSKTAPYEDKTDFTFYDSVKKEQPAALQPAVPPADVPPALDPPAKADPKTDAAPEGRSKLDYLVNYQIGAVRKQSDAEKLLSQLKKKGFRAFILAPSAGDRNPFFRVQVGPFADPGEAQTMKKKLESAGYQPILKK
jgi:cell division septation protein DedD